MDSAMIFNEDIAATNHHHFFHTRIIEMWLQWTKTIDVGKSGTHNGIVFTLR
jgi:hypothetical protein